MRVLLIIVFCLVATRVEAAKISHSCDSSYLAARFNLSYLPTISVYSVRDALEVEIRLRSKTMTGHDASKIADIIYSESKRYGYDPFLFLAVIHIESYFNHLAISPAGAEGLMQLMPATAEKVAFDYSIDWQRGDSFKPEVNVRLGILYLVELLEKYNKLEVALTAYNRGPKNTNAILNKFNKKIPEFVLDSYAKPVLKRKIMYKRLYNYLPANLSSAY